MIAVNYSTARRSFKDYCDKVVDNDETVIVTRKKDKNVVIISEERYSEMEKAERNSMYLRKLDRGLAQVRAGHGIVKSMAELEAMAQDYLYWQTEDRKTLKRINQLLADIQRNGLSEGIGKPEPLRHVKEWSRRIDETNRLVYTVEGEQLVILSCRGHYED